VPDTLTYLQSIVTNKAQFIGQPFSKLMDSLKIKIRYFHPRRSITYNINKETSTRFAFYFPSAADDLYLTYPSLEVYWQPYLDARLSDILWENNNAGGWVSAVATFYRPGIIVDIKLRN
jgi:hypothetical protein